MPPVDLRSDTLTRPTEAMRAAMAAAEVGDDVYGEDAPALAAAAREQGVLVSVVGPRAIRLVTHLDVDDAGATKAAGVVRELLAR